MRAIESGGSTLRDAATPPGSQAHSRLNIRCTAAAAGLRALRDAAANHDDWPAF